MATVGEITERLGVTRMTVIRWLREGRIQGAVKVGKSWQIPDDWELTEDTPRPRKRKAAPIPSAPIDEAVHTEEFGEWAKAQVSVHAAKELAQAEDLYWRARERARKERLAEGELMEVGQVQAMVDGVFAAIDAVMGDSLAVSWQGRTVTREDVRQVMEQLRTDIRARWVDAGIDI